MKRPVLMLHLLPLALPYLLFLGGGLIYTLFHSLGVGAVAEYEGAGLDAYRELLGDPLFLRNALFSLKIALRSAVGALFLGSLLAFGIWRLPSKVRPLAEIYRIPLILPHITVAFLILFLFSRRGWVPALFQGMGFSAQSPGGIINNPAGTAMVLAYIYKEIPFVILMELAVLQTIPEDMIATARQLGAGNGQIYRSIVLPQLYPVMNTLFVILLLYTFGAFDIPFLLGTSRPSMLSIDIYRLYFERDLVHRPLVMARLVLMFAFSLLVLTASGALARRFRKGGRP